jgi:hypothetical protein
MGQLSRTAGSLVLSLIETSYPRGGGESGTEDDSSGVGSKVNEQAPAFIGAASGAGGVRTAGGPISDAAIAAIGSAVLRQEQSEAGVDPDADRG